MQLTQFTDYSLRVLVYAAVASPGRCLTGEAAAAFGISRHHVVKVVNQLQHLGYIDTVRGRGGGFALARPPREIGLGEVVRRAEGLAVVECFDAARNTCPLAPACGLKGVLGHALDAFLSVLDRHTLADLVSEPRWRARVAAVSPRARTAAAARAGGRRRPLARRMPS
jgi:Rrf2 family nitric oxide-sensitive transcriptional repressor